MHLCDSITHQIMHRRRISPEQGEVHQAEQDNLAICWLEVAHPSPPNASVLRSLWAYLPQNVEQTVTSSVLLFYRIM